MYKREKQSWLKHLDFTILDILCTQIAYIIAYRLRFDGGWPYENVWYERLAVVLVLLEIVVTFFTEPYKNILRRNKFDELKRVVVNASLTYFLVIIYIHATKQSDVYSRLVLYGFWVLSIPLCYIVRVIRKRVVRRRVLESKERTSVLLITDYDDAAECISEFESYPYRDYTIKGIVLRDFSNISKGDFIRGIPVVCDIDHVFEYVCVNVVDEVFCNMDSLSENEALSNMLVEMGVTVHCKLFNEAIISRGRSLEKYGKYTVLTGSMNIASDAELFIKRLMDILGSIIGLLFTLIAIIIFGPIIKHQSPGPIFFRQVRVGKNGRRFRIVKFRSMITDAEAQKAKLMDQNKMDAFMFKMDSDPRIIPIGRFMRKYSIDELPQFWNILMGDMSLVGTRPPTEDEFVKYEAHHRARLGIKPGLTGMWQVNGRSDITDFEEVVALDTEYIQKWSLWLDIKILFKTIAVVFKGDGAV